MNEAAGYGAPGLRGVACTGVRLGSRESRGAGPLSRKEHAVGAEDAPAGGRPSHSALGDAGHFGHLCASLSPPTPLGPSPESKPKPRSTSNRVRPDRGGGNQAHVPCRLPPGARLRPAGGEGDVAPSLTR